MAKAKNEPTDVLIHADLDSIKRLIMLLLLKAGATQGEIAMALGVDQSVVSRMFSAKKVKKFD